MPTSQANGAWRFEYRQALKNLNHQELHSEYRSVLKLVMCVKAEAMLHTLAFGFLLPNILYIGSVAAGVFDPPGSGAMVVVLACAMYAVSKVIEHSLVTPRRQKRLSLIREAHQIRLVKLELLSQECERRGIRL